MRVYAPYKGGGDTNQPEASSATLNSAPVRWGTQDPPNNNPTQQTSNTTSVGGSTYNITNNNNINYNYGANITAISSEGNVPTFNDSEKSKKPADDGSTLGYLSSAVGSIVPTSVSGAIQNSKGFAKASDSIKRAVGVDIHRAMGGKSAVEVAEERLEKERREMNTGFGSHGPGGYQGI